MVDTQSFCHGRAHSRQVRVDDVFEVGLQGGAQGQGFRTGLRRGQFGRDLRPLFLQLSAFGLQLLEALLRRLVGGVEFGLTGFDVLDTGLGRFEFPLTFGDAGGDGVDLCAVGFDPGLEVGDPLGRLRLLRLQRRPVLHRFGDGDLCGPDLVFGGAQSLGELFFPLLAGLECGRLLGHGRLGVAQLTAEPFGLFAQLFG